MTKSFDQLLAEAQEWSDRCVSRESLAVDALIKVVRDQQARIVALERIHPTAGIPLEGTGPLPLERKGA